MAILLHKFGSAFVSIRDLPPEGGFEALKYKRSLPFRGPSGLVLLLGTLGICTFGFYRFGLGAMEKR